MPAGQNHSNFALKTRLSLQYLVQNSGKTWSIEVEFDELI
jgi:hypothetical protein